MKENQKLVKSKDVKHECQFIRTMKIEEILVKSKDVKHECQFIRTMKIEEILVKSKDVKNVINRGYNLQVKNENSDVLEHRRSGIKTQEAGVGNLY